MDPLLRHFDLTEHPFSLSPDPRFFYIGPVHKGIIAKTDYVVRRRQGLTVIFGDIGLGKTTLARILLDRLREDHLVTFVTNPNFKSEMHMTKAISAEFGIAAKRSQHAQLMAIKEYLTGLYANEKNPVLILDEAQLLKGQQFEVLRQLSNFETNDTKLLQIVLVGQLELRNKLKLKRALTSRIAVYSSLQPLAPHEMADMIAFRLTVAGGNSGIFSDQAMERIFEHSKGIPREAIKLCAVCMEFGAGKRVKQITPEIVDAAAPEVKL